MTTTSSKLIRFGHSPDPDDAFMFYAFAENKIPMNGFKVEHVIEDIESLNQRALKNAELEVTAVSCHAYAYLSEKYVVIRSGGSFGDNYGPILVGRPTTDKLYVIPAKAGNQSGSPIIHQGDCLAETFGDDKRVSIKGKRIAIPGKLTTAYLALQLYAKEFEPVFMPFDQILDAVKSGKVDFGLIIHEGQITYEEYGLKNVLDLGKWWHEKTELPLPLGVDVIRKDLGEETIKSFSKIFKESIEYALNNRKPALKYAIKYGRGISSEINDRFVGMYVNEYTVDMGSKGRDGFRKLLEEGFRQGILPEKIEPIIV